MLLMRFHGAYLSVCQFTITSDRQCSTYQTESQQIRAQSERANKTRSLYHRLILRFLPSSQCHIYVFSEKHSGNSICSCVFLTQSPNGQIIKPECIRLFRNSWLRAHFRLLRDLIYGRRVFLAYSVELSIFCETIHNIALGRVEKAHFLHASEKHTDKEAFSAPMTIVMLFF